MGPIDPAKLNVLPGRGAPQGATIRPGGVRFAIVSRHATRVWLALFNKATDTVPAAEIECDPVRHKIGDVWSVFIPGLGRGALYAYRMDGPLAPEEGHRFDPSRYLLDPCARAIVGDIAAGTAKGLVVNEDLDWTDDLRPGLAMGDTVIYETHVRGFTMHRSSGVKRPGTYLGLIEKIPYLKELGVTTVEIMPVQEFCDAERGRANPLMNEPLRNYWGYSPVGFFALTSRYATQQGKAKQVDEFRRMVAALHQVGLEIILDVVLNHTAEGNEDGPTLSFKGVDNALYYMLDDEGRYLNFSGCGNTFNCGHPVVRDFILECLRFWVTVFHVDGFRFDLASVLGRDREGKIIPNSPLVERIAEDPLLRSAKLIAEAWDAGGAYQVGSFGNGRWAEWNGRFRDDVRQYWLTGTGRTGDFASRLTGSSDLYEWAGRGPMHSINFITAHDGFTLRDLVSYNEKHNEMNGEENRDGTDLNFSWNCGVEGETDDPEINALRRQMQKNLLATLCLSLGVPMLLGGDEFGRTQKGNNNAYCQDNEISWYNWSLLEKNRDLSRFCKELIRLRKENPVFRRDTFFTGELVSAEGDADVLWFDAGGEVPDWDAPAAPLACWINPAENNGVALYMMFNPTPRRQEFPVPAGSWAVRIDTAAPSPQDVANAETARHVDGLQPVGVSARSLMVLSFQGYAQPAPPTPRRPQEIGTGQEEGPPLRQ